MFIIHMVSGSRHYVKRKFVLENAPEIPKKNVLIEYLKVKN